MDKKGDSMPLWLIVLLISAVILLALGFLIIKNKIIDGVFRGI
ncbi:MAG: hypothetical protein QT09_C0010G0018 [archaeon GW2011_AR18]|nr:MAG: hypothetical protein QT09_C0010G0018 [archaeon GW2011_AR18]